MNKKQRKKEKAKKIAQKSVRYLMLIILAALSLVVFLEAVFAEGFKVPVIENGVLVVKESKVVKVVPNVPKELWDNPNLAYELVTDETKETVIKKDKVKSTFRFDYPVERTIIFSDRLISYEQGQWKEKVVSRTEKKNDWDLTVYWLWLVALLILFVSIDSAISKTKTIELIVFYVGMLVSVSLSVLASLGLSNMFTGELTGEIVGIITGLLIGGFVGLYTGKIMGMLAGIFSCAIAGAIASKFTDGQSFEIIVYYLAFLLIVELISFIVYRFIGAIKGNGPAKSEKINPWVYWS